MSTEKTSARVAVITGGFGALGRVVATTAVARGYSIAVPGHSAKPPADVAETLGPNALLLGGVDLTDETAAKTAMEAVMARFGRIDVLFNIAGGFHWTKIADSHQGDPEAMFRMNVQTTANAARAAIPALKASRSGRIVN